MAHLDYEDPKKGGRTIPSGEQIFIGEMLPQICIRILGTQPLQGKKYTRWEKLEGDNFIGALTLRPLWEKAPSHI